MKTKTRIDTNRLLMLIAASLAVLIILVTAAAIASGKRPGAEYRHRDPDGVQSLRGSEAELREFKEFGTLRLRTLPRSDDDGAEKGSLLIVTPWLSYEERGPDFYEELVSKKKLFGAYFTEYFSSRTKNELLSLGEKNVKQMLLDKMNAELILGKLSALYFDDYMFME